MEIDHIFIFSNQGNETEELIEFGLTEGSGRVHKGIGTVNRRIFFDNFYLEILWVENKDEAGSIEEIGILERSNFKNSQYSRFGLCLNNTPETDQIFENAIQWKPEFLPGNSHVDILTNDRMPWIFRFPKNRDKKTSEIRHHKNGIKKLTKAIFYVSKTGFENELREIEKSSFIEFKDSPKNSLYLEFDDKSQGKSRQFYSLDLNIHY